MQIIKYPHPTLRHKSKPLKRVDAELRKMVREMFELMYEHEGVGLSANQVDLPYRLFVVNLESDPDARDQEHVFINPVITQRKGLAEDREGCLSFPKIFAPVKRPEKVTLNAYTLAGDEITCDLDGLAARAVQHETDHLDGVVFVDRLSTTALSDVKEDLAILEQNFQLERKHGRIAADEAIAARLCELETART